MAILFELRYGLTENETAKPDDIQPFSNDDLLAFTTDLKERMQVANEKDTLDKLWLGGYHIFITWEDGLQTQYIYPPDFFIAIYYVQKWTGVVIETGSPSYGPGKGRYSSESNWFLTRDNREAFDVFVDIMKNMYPDQYGEWHLNFHRELENLPEYED